MNFKKMFAKFPIIGTQFDFVTVDAVLFKDEEENTTFYSPMLTYVILDKKTGTAAAGFILQTGAICSSYLELAKFVHSMATNGLFLVDLGAQGVIYTEAMDVAELVNWNDYIEHVTDNTEKPKPTLH